MKTKNKLLIVEDEKPLLGILKEEFTKSGYKVYIASDGQAGLKLAFNEKPDLILLDLIMPKMDGMKMLKKLREDKWGKNAPVLILTNIEGNAKKTVEALENGVFEYIVKNRWTLEDLKKRVKEKLGANK